MPKRDSALISDSSLEEIYNVRFDIRNLQVFLVLFAAKDRLPADKNATCNLDKVRQKLKAKGVQITPAHFLNSKVQSTRELSVMEIVSGCL